MPTTTNYGWTTPADTDLVKDGASAIRTLGNGVDTTVKNLNPETTLGDISYRSSTANTNTRLAIGTSGQVLTVSGGVPTWATASAGGYTELASGSLSGATTRIQSLSTDYRELVLIIKGFRPTNTTPKGRMYLRVNNDSGNNYWLGDSTGGINYPQVCDQMSITDYTKSIVVATFPDYARTDTHHVYYAFAKYVYSVDPTGYNSFGRYAYTPSTSAAITELDIFTSEGTWDSGSYVVYGVK